MSTSGQVNVGSWTAPFGKRLYNNDVLYRSHKFGCSAIIVVRLVVWTGYSGVRTIPGVLTCLPGAASPKDGEPSQPCLNYLSLLIDKV